jgi:hypothetical protein
MKSPEEFPPSIEACLQNAEKLIAAAKASAVPMTDSENNLRAGRFNFRGYTFSLCLVPEKFDMLGDSHLLYRETTLNCRVQERVSHIVKGWAK